MRAYLTFGTEFPWPTFSAPLTQHDRDVIAELSAIGATKIAADKAESLAKLVDHKKMKRALKTWGQAPRSGMRWNSITAKWE